MSRKLDREKLEKILDGADPTNHIGKVGDKVYLKIPKEIAGNFEEGDEVEIPVTDQVYR